MFKIKTLMLAVLFAVSGVHGVVTDTEDIPVECEAPQFINPVGDCVYPVDPDIPMPCEDYAGDCTPDEANPEDTKPEDVPEEVWPDSELTPEDLAAKCEMYNYALNECQGLKPEETDGGNDERVHDGDAGDSGDDGNRLSSSGDGVSSHDHDNRADLPSGGSGSSDEEFIAPLG